MVDTRAAILRGATEAEQAHHKLDIRQKWGEQPGRIDVFGAIDAFGLPLLFRPLVSLLGAFLPDPTPGVIVNTRRPLAVRRFTAAHELGHFVMGHHASLDDETILGRSPFPDRASYDTQEIEANAFAATFLMPLWFVAGQMKRHSWRRESMTSPVTVYQLALRAGLSYEATCYALRKYNIIDGTTCIRLAKEHPKSIKQALVPGFKPDNWFLDVWQLRDGDNGVFVDATLGDILEIDLEEHAGAGYVWDAAGLKNTDLELLDDRREAVVSTGEIGGHVFRHIITRAGSSGFGSVRFVETRPWQNAGIPLASFSFSYSFTDLPEPGLLATQRERLLKVAQ